MTFCFENVIFIEKTSWLKKNFLPSEKASWLKQNFLSSWHFHIVNSLILILVKNVMVEIFLMLRLMKIYKIFFVFFLRLYRFFWKGNFYSKNDFGVCKEVKRGLGRRRGEGGVREWRTAKCSIAHFSQKSVSFLFDSSKFKLSAVPNYLHNFLHVE